MLETICLLGVKVSKVSPIKARTQIFQWIKEKQRTYVCVAPVSTLVDAQHDSAYADVINAAGMVTPDGMPVVWLAKAKGCADIERTYGPNLMLSLCQEAGVKHFFYGGTEAVLENLKIKLKQRNPSMDIVGSYAPDFSPHAKVESSAIIDMINASQPDIIWVALGSPKQDFWMSYNRAYLNAPVLMGVGAAFDFLSGTKSQAPRWIQQSGLEWLFRLCCEPKRLWRRYLVGNTLFIFYILKSLLRERKISHPEILSEVEGFKKDQ